MKKKISSELEKTLAVKTETLSQPNELMIVSLEKKNLSAVAFFALSLKEHQIMNLMKNFLSSKEHLIKSYMKHHSLCK